MARRLSFGSVASMPQGPCEVQERLREAEARGSAVNYPGNPRFRPRFSFKLAYTSDDLEAQRQLLTNLAVVITEEGPLRVQSREEVKDIMLRRLGVRKHECYVYRSSPEPFIVIFSNVTIRDLVLDAGRVTDGPIMFQFHAWDIDRYGSRVNIPFQVKLSIEGIPQHAWFEEIVDKCLCDEAVIHHVEEASKRRLDQRMYVCWALTQDPSRIPQTVFLTLAKHIPRRTAQVHFTMPINAKRGHVFRVIIHIDKVEDLHFYHYPREELIADGRVQWRDFHLQQGRADGELEEDELHPPTEFCHQDRPFNWNPRDDDEGDREHKRARGRGIFNRVAGGIENRGKGRER